MGKIEIYIVTKIEAYRVHQVNLQLDGRTWWQKDQIIQIITQLAIFFYIQWEKSNCARNDKKQKQNKQFNGHSDFWMPWYLISRLLIFEILARQYFAGVLFSRFRDFNK